MKKTLLGKVTLGLTCVCLCLFIAVKILDIWGLGRSLGGFENMMKFFIEAFKQGEGMTVLVLACKTFLLPIIWIWAGLLYILALVYVIRYMIKVIRILSADAGIELIYALLAYIIHPAVFLVVAVLVLGYSLFPEKYMEA